MYVVFFAEYMLWALLTSRRVKSCTHLMNKQKHIVDVKKNTVWYPALSRLVSVSQTGEGTSHFRATDLDRKSLFGYV